jgi:hypothetical protein
MRVLVCGGRDFTRRTFAFDTLDGLHARTPIAVVIEGGALGADQAGRDWANARGVPVETYPADWKNLGRAAGVIRNQQMLDQGCPDLVVAFTGGRGTADMVHRAIKSGIQVVRP